MIATVTNFSRQRHIEGQTILPPFCGQQHMYLTSDHRLQNLNIYLLHHVKQVKCCFDDEGNEAANVDHDFQKLHPVISNSTTGGEINNNNNVREMRGRQNSLSW
jgi:hypothetical protein